MNKLAIVVSVFLIIGLIFGTDSIVLASGVDDPKSAWDYIMRSELKQANGEWDAALADVNKAIEINNTMPNTNMEMEDDDNIDIIHFLNSVYKEMEEALQSNETIDIF